MYTAAETVPEKAGKEEKNRIYAENIKKLIKSDESAMRRGSMNGRVIREYTKDGSSLYRVVRKGKKTVRIAFCRGVGESENPVPYWGEEAMITVEYAEEALRTPAFGN